ncbi:DDB1- and CUL4-associated factor 12 [Haplosporangium sp. Z 27]|nr:DDB1- and CUL4-associated factor 12 [Haplosporangium sp. Z 27]
MSNEQAMEFDSLEPSTGSSSYPSSLSRGLRGPRFMSAQLGSNERRMSTPSISTTPKQSSQPRFDDARSSSTSSSPSASSLSLPSTSSQCRNTSTSQRLSSLYSVARTWISTSPSIFDRGESNGHSNIDQPERSSSSTDDDCSSYKPDAIARYISATIPNIISEREYCVDKYDKIFAGTWVTNEEVLFGTKCNKVVLLNTETGRQLSIPRLDECLLGNVDDALSRVRETASSAQSSNTSQILSGSSTAAYKHPLGNATVNNISNDFSGLDFATRFTERNLHFNLGRRSSTPSFFSEPSPGHINMYSSTRSPPAVSTTNTTATQELAASTGIRSIAINPSRTLLAIGSGEPFQVTIYSLPELAPVGMMYGHKGLVFALTWVSDTVLVTGGRDGSMRVWSMASPALTVIPSVRHEIQVRLPEITRAERNTRVRDLAFNKGSEKTMTLHTDGYVKLWDRNSYAELHRLPLKYTVEAVCLTSSVESNLFVVGSQSHLCILDPRASKIVHEAESCDEGCGIRSLDFKSHIVTIGDGYGRIGFYDVRAKAYLNVFDDGKTKRRHHEIGPGSLDQDTVYAGNVAGMTIRSAVYAMEYDSSGTRLFAAGGPIQVGLSGAYAGLWS